MLADVAVSDPDSTGVSLGARSAGNGSPAMDNTRIVIIESQMTRDPRRADVLDVGPRVY